MKHVRIVAVLVAVGLLGYFGWSALHPSKVAASNDPSGTFLITITDPTTGNVDSYEVITLHSDHSVAVIDSNQEGNNSIVPFSSEHGVWERDSNGVLEAITIDWRFPYASNGSARVDYTFNGGVPPNQVQGTGKLFFFAAGASPLGDSGTLSGKFNFTGTRVTVP